MTLSQSKQSRGFSLIELMVSMVAGLIVTGAVLTFTMASLRSNTDYVQATRLSQELRITMDQVSRELRRAGYDESAMEYVSASTATAPVTSPFGPILIVADGNGDTTADDACVIYAYDRAPGTPGQVDLGNNEIRAMRRMVRTVNGASVGVIEFAESATGLTPTCAGASPDYTTYPASCHATSGWCALSDPRVLDVTVFSLDTSGSLVQGGTPHASPQQIREVGVNLQGGLVGDTNVVRGVQSNVRVRADCMQDSTACDLAPTGT